MSEDTGTVNPKVIRFLNACIDPSDRPDPPLPTYHIYPWLAKGGCHLIIAPPKCGKTYVALEICWSMATGDPFLGQWEVDVPGLWLFIAGEGADATWLRWRLMQQQRRKQLPSGSILIYPHPVNFAQSKEVDTLISAALLRKCAGLIIDTASRCGAGAEDSEVMPAFVEGITRACNEAHLTTIILHHTPKTDPTSARGHTSLPAAVDSQWNLSATGAEERRVFTLSSKFSRWAGSTDEPIGKFRVVSMDAGRNPHGRLVTMGVVEALTPTECKMHAARTRISALEKQCLDALDTAISSVRPQDVLDMDAELLGSASEDMWRMTYYRQRREAQSDVAQEALKKAFQRYRKALEDKGRVAERTSGYWEIL